MEERLVLDVCKARVVQEVAEHETSWLIGHPWLLHEIQFLAVPLTAPIRIIIIVDVRVLILLLLSVLFKRYRILASLLVQMTFHQDVEEVSHGCIIRQLTADVGRPEERMRTIVLSVGEADQVNCHVDNNILRVERLSDGLADLGQVDLRQGRLGREAADVDELGPLELVEGADEASVSIRLDHESDRGVLQLIELTERWGALDDTTDATELS